MHVGLIAAGALAVASSPVAANVFQFQTNLGTDSPDSFVLNGRGSQTIAMRNYESNSNHEITIHTTTLGSGGLEISVPQAELFPTTEFGKMDLVGDHVTGQMLFATDINKMDSTINVYKAKWYGDEWTEFETISPPVNTSSELIDPPYYFGSQFAVDHKSFRSIAVGYGDATPFLNYPVGYGKICMYEATSPSAKEWLSTQVLSIDDAETSIILRLGGSFVNMYDDVIVADTFQTTPSYRLEIFNRGRNGMWSHQQSFAPPSSSDLTLAVVYEKTIVYALNDLSSSGSDLIGKSSVVVMHPNTPDFDTSDSRRLDAKSKPKPKPKALKWSVVQTLLSPNHNSVTPSSGSDVGFGSDLGFYGDVLTVGEVGDGANTGFLYVFERTSKIGMFSLQQTITPSIGTNNYLSLHALNNGILMASSIHSTNGASNDIWVGQNTAWGCLNIKLDDAFGDGWDGARLRIDTPFKDIDHFAPVCHTNPLVFRYCPSDISQEGKYSLKIVDSKKAKYSWEIRWLVTEESTGNRFRGDHSTSMDFIFEDGNFKSGKTSHLLPTNATCHSCGGYPAIKPKPKPKPSHHSRRLDPGHTSSPTISPAPTLSVTADVSDWDYMKMLTTGGDWFDDEYIGTHFYISDVDGQNLISTGTLCSGHLTGSCLQDLPNGQYTLRVTGDLNSNSVDHSWAFCSRVGSASDSLTFEISNGMCTPLMRVTTSDACVVINPVSGVSAYSIALGSFFMSGAAESTMTALDKAAFEEAVLHTIPGAVTGGVSITGVEVDSGDSSRVIISFSVQINTQELGYDPLDYHSLSAMYDMEKNQLSANRLSQKMVAELSQSGRGMSSYFASVESVALVTFEMSSGEFVKSPLMKKTESAEEPEAMFEDEVAHVDNEHLKHMYYDLGIAGYVLAVAAIGGMVVLVILRRRNLKKSRHDCADEAVDSEETISI
eukprot:CAMPEP_0114428206 /NCGR_PEP_ID=MMETSP0103-20121206/8799_1 /TAXON_ID=37642 ORGANISM="Paraphysomonas imperforata, Strain PA2" /NCGR_SAMPLE_ID=MMETSP0103 /ASSEMBLY_ACC=CAM_ASM_000201 /LENGTH=939 /DNA_ID=CAMNT_0001597401 /DNA_START=83 /DNA_END=2902 /DNA_ORIENTATION=+